MESHRLAADSRPYGECLDYLGYSDFNCRVRCPHRTALNRVKISKTESHRRTTAEGCPYDEYLRFFIKFCPYGECLKFYLFIVLGEGFYDIRMYHFTVFTVEQGEVSAVPPKALYTM